MDPSLDDGIAVPPGKLRVRIEQLATILVKLEMEKGAETAMKKREAIAVQKAEEYPFLHRDHPYFPFFETRLRMFKSNPSLMPKFKKKEEAAAAEASAAAAASGPTLSEQEQQEERERRIREEQLAAAELEAKRDRVDPHPNVFSLQLPAGVSISRPMFDVMTLTAQCAAKGGRPFLDQITRLHRGGNRLFAFTSDEDPAYPTFLGLIDAYDRILKYKPEEVQDRLEVYEKGGAPLQEVFTAKANFMTAEAARTKAAVLTDDQLRKRLQWNVFTVKKTFTAADLGLTSASSSNNATAKESKVEASAHVPSGAIGWGDDDNTNAAAGSSSTAGNTAASSSSAASHEVVGIAKRSGNSEYVKDPTTGELVHISQITRKGNGGGNEVGGMFGTSNAPSSGVVEQVGQKRERDDGLASYAAFEAHLRK